jgi:hypothetical protein
MSEFSQSFHLRSSHRNEAVELLMEARVPGYVFDAAGGWVPFVFPVGSRFGLQDHLERVVAANSKVLLKYDYAEDHGCGAALYNGSTQIGRLSVDFESTKPGHFDRETFIAHGLLTAAGADKIQRWVSDVGRKGGSLVVAANLGLPRHEWFSYEDVHGQRDDVDNFLATCTEVRKDGTVVTDDVDVRSVQSSPLYDFAVALIEELVATNAIELAPKADREQLAEDVCGRIAELDGDDPAFALQALLMNHDGVDEVFADDVTLAATMRQVREQMMNR